MNSNLQLIFFYKINSRRLSDAYQCRLSDSLQLFLKKKLTVVAYATLISVAYPIVYNYFF